MTTETNEKQPEVAIEINTAPEQDAVNETETAAETAQETADVAVQIAVEAVDVAEETAEQVEDFETWARTQIQELTTTLNMVAEVQLVQAEQVEKLSSSTQMNSTEMLTESLIEPVEMTEMTEAELMEVEPETPSEPAPEPVEEAPLQSAVQRLKSRIRLL